jgi:peptidoglycan/xylan/chitin deacetylase (PgdA/CDA1 family)
LRQVLTWRASGQPAPPGSFVVTFDDGYENVYHHAWPVLRALKVPATLFLPTAYLDQPGPFPFDDWPGAGTGPPEAWRPLTTRQCAELSADGLIDLGSHTHTHAVFRDRPDDLFEDVAASLRVLRERFGLADATFAFPFGIAGPRLADAVRRAGVLCALTTESALAHPAGDPFAWGRFTVTEADSAASLAGKLDGWYNLARSAWRWCRRMKDEG